MNNDMFLPFICNLNHLSDLVFTSLSTIVQSYCTWRCFLWQILPRSAASLEYCAANNPNTETTPSHNISTPGQPVIVISSELGPFAQSVEPWNLDRRVPGSSLNWSGCRIVSLGKTLYPQWPNSWSRRCFVHMALRLKAECHAYTNKNVCAWKSEQKKSFKCWAQSAKFYVFGLTRDRSHNLPLTRRTL